MENNDKLKTNLLRNGLEKIGGYARKLPTTVMAVLALQCATAAYAKQPKKINTTAKVSPVHYEMTGNEGFKNIKNLSDSKLYGLTEYSILESKVQTEMVNLMLAQNDTTKAVAQQYRTMANDTIKNCGMSIEEINNISATEGKNTLKTEEGKNIAVGKISIGNFMQLMLESLAAERLGADSLELHALDTLDGVNEYTVNLNTKGERSIINETTQTMSAAKNDLLAYVKYGYDLNNDFNSQNIRSKVNANLNDIAARVRFLNTDQDLAELQKIVNETATLLPPTFFGDLGTRKNLIYEFAGQYLINHIIDNLRALGYNVDNMKAGEVLALQIRPNATTKIDNIEIRTQTSVGDYTTISGGVTAKTTWDNHEKVGLLFGGNLGVKIGDNGQSGVETLGKIGAEFNLGHNVKISAVAKAGLDLTPKAEQKVGDKLGGEVIASFPIGNQFSINVGIDTVGSIARSNVYVGGLLGTTYRFGNSKYNIPSITYMASVGKDIQKTVTHQPGGPELPPISGGEEGYEDPLDLPTTIPDDGDTTEIPVIRHDPDSERPRA